jgi:phosphoribosylformylglycinamidine synthase
LCIGFNDTENGPEYLVASESVALEGLGFGGVRDVRAGKVIELDLAEADPATAKQAAEDMARKLLANTVIESFRVEIV